jgi:para-nitrobenzyl esterase
MIRREFLRATLSASAGLALAGTTSSFAAGAQQKFFVTVETTAGKVRGITVDGVSQFRGVPYGASTAGRNRFMPPAPVASWSGIRDAYGYGAITPQPYSKPSHPFGLLIDFDLHVGAMSEDCLNLNVWTPGVNDGGKRPVLVYYHGGGLSAGSANHDLYVGDRLARFGNVVVITVNHRLSAFGYINLTDLGAPPEFADSGNAGLLDLVQSLQWVRDNVASFGGDPDRVTIFGQSGGGTKVGALMAMPAARKLFHRAAIQSGSLNVANRDTSRAAAQALLQQLGVRRGEWKKLQTLPAEAIVEAQLAIGTYDWISGEPQTRPSPQFTAVIDGRSLSSELLAAAALHNAIDVPLIVGYCLTDSGWTESNFDLDDAGLKDIAVKLAGSRHADRALDLYYRAYPNASPFIIQGAMMTDAALLPRVTELAQRKSTLNAAPVWVYRFDWPSQAFGGRFGPTHGMDMSLVFHNTHQPTIGGDTPEARLMADRMSSAWVAFAKDGDPNTTLLPAWQPYSAERRETMVINSPRQRLISDPNREFRELWAEIHSDRQQLSKG